jgi:opacity protein-like surface antigen
MSKIKRHVIVAASAALASIASAQTPASQEPPANEPQPLAKPPSTTDAVIESTQRTVRSTAEWLASGIDKRFGDKPFSDGGTVTDGQIGLSYLKRDGHGSNLGLRFNARFRLPNLSEIPYVFVGSDDERSIVTDQPDRRTLREQIRQRNSSNNSFFAGVGLWLADSVDVRIGFRGLLRPYAQARLRHQWQLTPDDLVEVRETVFYTVKDRAGSTLALEYQHAFTPDIAVRWLNAGTITQEQPDLTVTSNLGIFKSFGQQRVLGLELQYSDSTVDAITTNDIGIQLSWEQPLHKMILGEVTLGRYWPRSTTVPDRTGQWAAGATIGLKF